MKNRKLIAALLASAMLFTHAQAMAAPSVRATDNDVAVLCAEEATLYSIYDFNEDGNLIYTDNSGVSWHCEFTGEETLKIFNVSNVGSEVPDVPENIAWCQVTEVESGIFEDTPYYKNTDNWENGILYADNWILAIDENFEGEMVIKEGTEYMSDAYFGEYVTSISFPASMVRIDNSAFAWTYDSLKSISVDEANEFYTSSDGILFNKDKTELVYAPMRAFTGEAEYQYTIPESVKIIGDYAFYKNYLDNIVFPESLDSIGKYAFYECNAINSELTINSKHISNNAFSNCKYLINVHLTDSVESIEGTPFRSCDRLKRITIDENNTNYVVENGVLMDKTEVLLCPPKCEIEEFEVPEGISNIRDYAFGDNNSLKYISFPKSLRTIGSYSFYNCSELAEVDMSEGLESLDFMSFANCTSLISIEIPDTVTDLGEDTFRNCSGLENVEISKNLYSMGYSTFDNCISLKSITIPPSVQYFSRIPEECKDALTIHCLADTEAEEFAKKHLINYELIGKENLPSYGEIEITVNDCYFNKQYTYLAVDMQIDTPQDKYTHFDWYIAVYNENDELMGIAKGTAINRNHIPRAVAGIKDYIPAYVKIFVMNHYDELVPVHESVTITEIDELI